ncbi:hypothetical protein TYRP_015858 [Tyrophagus putrescentiae]|nr:hypothetical protein TYRP_015858 [Tyrophagus putrescentiae]
MFLMEMTHLDRGAPVAEIFSKALPGKFLPLERLDRGVGKSTTLNALVNYFCCNTFNEALETIEQLSEVIPLQFTLPHNETGKPVTIKSNNLNANECHEVGVLTTLYPKGFLFPFGKNVLRIIDTPGIGDTANTEQDLRNFESILTYLQMLKSLHGIIFITRGYENRKTAFFQYCITQLMTYLHKSVVQNIVFCFTYSQITPGTFGPGYGFDVLKAFFEKEISEVGIRLEKGRNAFFIENDAYRLLVAKKQGYEWKPIQKMLCEESWNYSVKQCVAMFTTIQTFTPHDLDGTISLNNAKKVISELVEPIIRLTQNIEKNIAKIEKNKEKLNRANTTREDLKELVEIEVEDLEKQSTDTPKMVCTNSSCSENVFRGHEKTSYSTVCCEPCNCYHFVDTFLDDFLKTFCSAMAFKLSEFSFVCQRCTCKTSDHEAICYEYVKIKRKVVNENAKKLLSETNDMIEQKKRLFKNFNDEVQNMERELETIENIGAQFDYFLAANSLFTAGHFDNFIPTVQITYRVNPFHHYTALAAVVQAQAGGCHMRKEAAKAEPAKLIVRLKVGEVEVQRLKGGDWPEADVQRTGQHTFYRLFLPVAVVSGKGNGEGQMAKPGKVFRNGGEQLGKLPGGSQQRH